MKALALILGPSFARSHRRGGNLFARVATWMTVARERGQLADLDTRMLQDIGLTREQAAREVARPFWDTITR